MALISCIECKKQISDQAAACPNCGAPIQRAATTGSPVVAPMPSAPAHANKSKAPLIIGLVLLILIGLAGVTVVGDRIRRNAVLFNDRIELKEGAAEGYGFKLTHSAHVRVSILSSPKPVNVMLMSEDQWMAYQQIKGSIFGGKYFYKQDLSRQNVMKWDAEDDLPPGSYRIVLERPHEAIIFTHPTVVDVRIIAI